MIFDFLKNVKEKKRKKELIKIMLMNINISEPEKSLYIQAIDILDIEWINKIYETLTYFVKHIEIKNLEEIQKKGFAKLTGLRKKEAYEKQKEINSFQFLMNNL